MDFDGPPSDRPRRRRLLLAGIALLVVVVLVVSLVLTVGYRHQALPVGPYRA